MSRSSYWASMILAGLGAVDSAYLYLYKISSNDQLCLGSSGCASVNYSSYSEVYGIPVSLLGILAYLSMIVILLLEKRIQFFQTNGPLFLLGISFAGMAFSTYLAYIEFFVIEAVCPFCVISGIVIAVIFILSIFRYFSQTTT